MDAVADRLWKRVDKTTECWTFTGCRLPTGYGMIRCDGRGQLTHRVAWQLEHGSIPEGMCVLHRCDNPPCCNPEHLFLGTQADNVRDMTNKGRHGRTGQKGADHYAAKLTDQAAAEIRAAPRGYGTGRALAAKYGVSEGLISMVRNKKRWG